MSDIKAIIFDCFGVLYPTFIDEFIELHKPADYDPTVLDEVNLQIDLDQIDQATYMDRVGAAIGVPGSYLLAEMQKALVPDDNLISLIRHSSKGYKFGLLSNAGREEISIIKRDGLDILFDATAVSYEVGYIKPDPKIYQVCLERLEVSAAKSLFIDDNLKNLSAAADLGMETLHYPRFGAIPARLKSLLQ